MEKRDTFSKILTVIGTVLVWIPILAPVVFGFISLGMDGIYRFDYLMPAELGILVFVAGAILLWGTIRARSQQKIVSWGLGIAVASIAILFAIGDVEPGSLRWGIAIGLLVAYTLSIVGMGIGGILLWKELFRK